ncbi:unnamed protein product, partial [Amoebophrya sp. A25]
MRWYQVEALSAALQRTEEHYEDQSKKSTHLRSLFHVFCGLGKTRLFCARILSVSAQFTLIVVPSLELIRQFRSEQILHPQGDLFANRSEWFKDFDFVAICSEQSEHAEELEKKGVRQFSASNASGIKEFFDKRNESDFAKKVVAIVTIDSRRELLKRLRENRVTIGLEIVDEA